MARPFRHQPAATTDLLVVDGLERWSHVRRTILAMPYLGPDHVLRIVGDGPRRHALTALAQSMGLAHRVLFYGRVSDRELDVLLTQSDVLCSLSSRGRDHFTVRRAAALGLGVVVSPAGAWTLDRNVQVSPEVVTASTVDAALAARIRRAANRAAKTSVTTQHQPVLDVYSRAA